MARAKNAAARLSRRADGDQRQVPEWRAAADHRVAPPRLTPYPRRPTTGEPHGITSTDRPTVSDAQAWRAAIEAMKPTTAPCPGMTGAKWEEMRSAAIDFLERFGDDALALGWTITDLFSVHPTAGVIRVDHCGALMISGEAPARSNQRP